MEVGGPDVVMCPRQTGTESQCSPARLDRFLVAILIEIRLTEVDMGTCHQRSFHNRVRPHRFFIHPHGVALRCEEHECRQTDTGGSEEMAPLSRKQRASRESQCCHRQVESVLVDEDVQWHESGGQQAEESPRTGENDNGISSPQAPRDRRQRGATETGQDDVAVPE